MAKHRADSLLTVIVPRTVALLFVGVIVAAWPAQAAASSAAAPLAITFGATSVDVTGATAGGDVVFFGVAHEFSKSRQPVPQLIERAKIVTADANGSAHLALPEGVPLLAVWGVVDSVTGAYLIQATPGFPASKVDASTAVKGDSNGQLKKLDWPYAELELLLVRPGSGLWKLYAAKNADLDENRDPRGFIRVDMKSFSPIGNSPSAPTHFERGDVLLIVDPGTMAYASLEVKP
jgi:hypothetical protein